MSRLRLIVSMIMFGLLGIVASNGITNRADEAVSTWLQRAAPALDVPSAVLVFLGNAEIMITGTLIVSVALYPWKPGPARAALQLAAALAILSLLAVALKHLIPHPAPPQSLGRHLPYRRGLIAVPISPFSFPSGHTVRATLATGLLLGSRPLLAGVLIICMMAALVYLGDHWTTDVLGGLCLGWGGVEILRARIRGHAL